MASGPPMVVLIDGVPDAEARLVRLEEAAPLGRRVAVVALDAARAWGDRVEIAQTFRRGDGVSGLKAVMRGVITERRAEEGSDGSWIRAVVQDRWSMLLDREVGTLSRAWLLRDGDGPVTMLRSGPSGNRGAGAVVGGGQGSAIFDRDGRGWTVGDALRVMLAASGVAFSWWLPERVACRPLDRDVSLSGRLGDVLDDLVEDTPIILRWDESTLRLEVLTRGLAGLSVSVGYGTRRSRPVWRDVTGRREAGAVRGVARSRGWRVESTFDLQPGWDPALQGLPDGRYDPSQPGDFAEVRQVFRRWVLNEDGSYSAAPYLAPEYDLKQLFEDDRVAATPVRFEAPVSRDSEGQPMAALVEVSEDGGSTWRVVTSRRLLTDRAGVMLTADDLGASFLTAARSGQARCRVTASLRSPVDVEERRWLGNAFSGAWRDVEYETGRRFAFRRVASGSRFWSQVRAGAREADERDDSTRMRRWLLERLRNDRDRRRVRLVRSGIESWLRPGDRLGVPSFGCSRVMCERVIVEPLAGGGGARSVVEGYLEG